MYKQIFALFLLATVANAQHVIGWTDCGSSMGRMYNIRITNCTQVPCDIQVGQSYVIEVDGSSLVNTNTLPFAFTATAFGLPIPVPILSGNACEHMISGNCPATPGSIFTFRIVYLATNILPPIPANIRGTVYNDFGDMGLCSDVPIIVRAAN